MSTFDGGEEANRSGTSYGEIASVIREKPEILREWQERRNQCGLDSEKSVC
jgi:hypothetical protein